MSLVRSEWAESQSKEPAWHCPQRHASPLLPPKKKKKKKKHTHTHTHTHTHAHISRDQTARRHMEMYTHTGSNREHPTFVAPSSNHAMTLSRSGGSVSTSSSCGPPCAMCSHICASNEDSTRACVRACVHARVRACVRAGENEEKHNGAGQVMARVIWTMDVRTPLAICSGNAEATTEDRSHACTHSLTHSLTPSLTHSLTPLLTHSLLHSLLHSPTHTHKTQLQKEGGHAPRL